MSKRENSASPETTSIQRKKFVPSSEVVLTEKGDIDLFDTILSRKDPTAQIPVISPLKPTAAPFIPSQSQLPFTSWASAAAPTASSPPGSLPSLKYAGPPAVSPSPPSYAISHRPKALKVFLDYVRSPESVPRDMLVWQDGDMMVIKDKFPKSTVHCLILPKTRYDELKDLAGEKGVKMVRMLQQRANLLIDSLKKEYPRLEFKMGFHAIPSMYQVHLHVLSQDFCADALKRKQHWNSFTTGFFLSPDAVMDLIRARGSFALTTVEVDNFKRILKQELRCHRCKKRFQNIPVLKEHLLMHLNEASSTAGASAGAGVGPPRTEMATASSPGTSQEAPIEV